MPSHIKNSIINYCSSHSLSPFALSLSEKYDYVGRLLKPGDEPSEYTDEEDMKDHQKHEWSAESSHTAAEAQDWEGHNPEWFNPSKKNPSESALYLNRTVSPLLLHHSWDKHVCLKAPAVLTDLLPKQTNSLSEFPVLFLSALDTSS